MTMAMRAVLVSALVLGGGGVGHPCFAVENPAANVSGLTAGKTGENWTISFDVGRPCDVTVRVMDHHGVVLRHLASGMVGRKTAAEPFKPKSLSQSILWDGTDDAGNKVSVEDCKAVVTAGLRAKFDKFIIWEKDACPRSRANNYFTTASGDCYVNQSSGVHLDTLRLFGNKGQRIRQVWPPTLNRPKDVLQEFLASKWGATDWDGDSVPLKVCYNSRHDRRSRVRRSLRQGREGVPDSRRCVWPRRRPQEARRCQECRHQ